PPPAALAVFLPHAGAGAAGPLAEVAEREAAVSDSRGDRARHLMPPITGVPVPHLTPRRAPMLNAEAVKKHLADCLHDTGEEARVPLPTLIRSAVKGEVWKHFTDARGQPFAELIPWLYARWPNGPGLESDSATLTYAQLWELCAGQRDVQGYLDAHYPLR